MPARRSPKSEPEGPATASRAKAIGSRAAALLLGVVIALGLAELGLRLQGYDPLGPVSRGRGLFLRESAHPDLDYELDPGTEGSAWGTTIAVNSRGHREREVAIPKPAGVRRIVAIGDSITFGNALAPEETWPRRLEDLLRAEGRDVEVLNLAVTGYDTLNEVAFLEHTGLVYEPDLVIVGFCFNDLGVHSIGRRTVRLLENLGPLGRRSRLAQLVMLRGTQAGVAREAQALDRDDVFRARYADRIDPISGDETLERTMAELATQLASIPARKQSRFLRWYTSEPRVGRLRHAFARLRALADAHGFAVMVMIIPFLDETQGSPAAFQAAYEVVGHEARRAGFEVVTLREAFRRRGFGALRMDVGNRLDDLHPNAAGHRVMAEHLQEALRDRSLDLR